MVAPMGCRLPLAVILLGGLGALAPLAHASPPDPLWVNGIYDGEDSDDVVLAATSTDKWLGRAPIGGVSPFLIVVESVPFGDLPKPSRFSIPALQIRAPPIL